MITTNNQEKSKQNKKKIIAFFHRSTRPQVLFAVIFAIALLFLIGLKIFPNSAAPKIETLAAQTFDENWRVESTGQLITLPRVIKTKADDQISITKVIPQNCNQGNEFYLALQSSWQSVRVSLDNTLIYEYYTQGGKYFQIAPPPFYHLVRIPANVGGQTLRITYSSPLDNYGGVLNEVKIGNQYDLTIAHIEPSLNACIMCFAILIIGFFTVLLCVYMHHKIGTSNHLFYVGIFSMIVAVWSACETKLGQFMMSNPEFNIYLTLFCVFLLPIPLLMFFRDNFKGWMRRVYNVLIYLYTLHFVIRLILQVTNVFGIYRSYAIYIQVSALVLLWIVISNIYCYIKYKERQTLFSMVAIVIFMFFASIDMARFLFGNLMLTNTGDPFIFFRIGILFFTFILVYSMMEEIIRYYQASIEANAYKKLAYTDSLSQLNNRTYLLELYPSIFKNAIRKEIMVAMVMLDIDNFKSYNDNYGHVAGDKVIHEIAQTIRQNVTHPLDTAIRYGGEEFLVVLSNTTKEEVSTLTNVIRRDISNLRLIHTYSEISSYVTVSQGIYCAVPKEDDTLVSFVERADKALYRAKENGKNQIVFY